MMSGFALAAAVDRAPDVVTGIEKWKRRQRRIVEWVQHVAYWYGQLALLPPPVRTAAFRALDRSELLKRVTLLAAARHDPTAADYWCEPYEIDGARVILTKASDRSVEDPFGAFSEWDSDADRKAYAGL